MTNFLEKHTKLIVGMILSFMFIVSTLNAYWDSAIFDETAHIGAAYSYVTQHEIRLNPEHPPLIKDLAGIPLLFLNLHFDTSQPFWTGTLPGKWDEGQWAAGRHLLYQADNNADKIIFWARMPIVILSIIFGWFIFYWVKELAGKLAGLFALTLYAFDPNILGHNHFVTTDLGIAAFTTFALYFYLKFIKSPLWKNVGLAGLFLGLLMLTKFSFITLLPILFLATIIYPLVINQNPEGKPQNNFHLRKLGEYVGKGAAIFGISLLVVWSVYTINTFRMNKETVSKTIDNNFSLSDTNIKNVYTNKTLHWLNDHSVTRPLTEFGIGIGYVFRRVSGGNGAYFMSQVSGQAFRAYFPTVFILKEPLPTLSLILLALDISLGRSRRVLSYLSHNNFREKWNVIASFIRLNIISLTLFLFIVLYSYISITGNLNIGFRHLFPILPFTYILIAKIVFDFINRKETHSQTIWYSLILFFSIFLISGTASAYPYYMSYFNPIAGGPKLGYRYVTDSNADWGQDLKRLKVWIADYNFHKNESSCKLKKYNLSQDCRLIDKIHLNYFGGADIKYYLDDQVIEWWDSKRPIEPGWYAISTNYLQGSLYDKEKKDSDSYRWINKQGLKPVYQVGTSILIYYITDKEAAAIRDAKL